MEKSDLSKVENWIQRSTGYKIVSLTPQESTMLPTYVGEWFIPVRTEAGVQRMPFDFEIVTDSIEGAFAKFSECALVKAAEIKKDMMEKSRSVVSGAGVDVNKIPFSGIIKP